MARIYRNSSSVIAWLGLPSCESEFENVRSLSQAEARDCTNWTAQQWEGFRYLSYHRYWSRVWVVQEVLLAPSMSVWCGFFSFPRLLFTGASRPQTTVPKSRFSEDGRPQTVADPVSRLCSPAERIVTHRTRVMPRPNRDVLARQAEVGTLEEMTAVLSRPHIAAATYQSYVPDLIHEVVRRFGRLECSDPRDKLYGFLGILKEDSRAKVKPCYTKDVSYAYRQALKLGLEEISHELTPVVFIDRSRQKEADRAYLAYYCDARDSFGMRDVEGMDILRQVIAELGLQTRLVDAMADLQHQNKFPRADARMLPGLGAAVGTAAPTPGEFERPVKDYTGRGRLINKLRNSIGTWESDARGA
ncbi:hypothetical protein F4779DRAFT_587768 [Xylariaceae sp. FL0662B]|nr:hypothetical protein F4779DRAFT_587768 [Xylariaceae sp. FL0662B]